MSQPLYSLPNANVRPGGSLFLGPIALTVSLSLFVFSATTVVVAHRLGYPVDLDSELWFVAGGSERWGLMAAAGSALALAIAALRTRRRRTWAIAPAAIAVCTSAAAWLPIYAPHALLLWAWRYRDIPEVDHVLGQALLIITIPGHLVVAILLGAAVWRAKQMTGPTATHGSARFALADEIHRSKLDAPQGIIFGGWRDGRSVRYLRYDGPGHALIFAPSRSGKGVTCVLPTLLSIHDSVLVHDPKGECWHRTAGWRSRDLGQRCLQLNPVSVSGDTAAWNPLDEIELGPREVRDAQQIADVLTTSNGKNDDPHWRETAADILTGAILHVLYVGRDPSLAGVLELLSRPDASIEATLTEMLTFSHRVDAPWRTSSGAASRTHPVVASAARTMLNRSENERASVLSTAIRALSLWREPIVANNTRRSDFRIADLVHEARGVSVYITVPVSDLSRVRALSNLLFSLAIRKLTEDLEGARVHTQRRRLLLLLDEFPQLEYIPQLEQALSIVGGFGIRVLVVTQDLTQIQRWYGPRQAITGNCEVIATFRASNVETAELVSRMAGEMTVHRQVATYTGNRLAPWLSHVMRSEQETQRRLVTADEVMRLPEDALLVFAGAQPIQGVKTPYFLDREFQQRASLEPPAIARVTRPIGQPPAPATPERSVPTDDELLAQLLPLDDELEIECAAESDVPSARSATPQLSELL